ncbi:hypothetical protein [Bradyrhizobium sp.]|uniref:hypothetical protein n=1 Tax=Bradyrhizobium sp. TaxID=376 RepID=UPI003C3EAC68
MNHKGVEYQIAPATVPGFWKWQFSIGDKVKAGKTETRIAGLAARRTQLKIDQELRKLRQDGTGP